MKFQRLFAFLIIASFFAVATMPVLANAETTTPKCAVLIDFGNGNVSWADIPVNSTLNAFNATQMAAEKLGLDFQYTHYSFGNYITKIGDGNATLTEYWSLWVWNSTEARWDSSMVGPDSIGATTVTAIAYSFGASSSPAPWQHRNTGIHGPVSGMTISTPATSPRSCRTT